MVIFFFFQAEDGIRDYKVTGVQTCALPILRVEANFNPAFLQPEQSIRRDSPIVLPEPSRLAPMRVQYRSEEHTSELQSPCNIVCRLLLEKKICTAAALACLQYRYSLTAAAA